MADQVGDYEVELVVTDTASLTSAPSNMTVVSTPGVGVLDSDGDGVADNEEMF